MININSQLISKNQLVFTNQNRAFKYGDGVFETLKIYNSNIVFFEEHYFRLMASMRMLRMEIPQNFTLEYLENEILKTADVNNLSKSARVRLTVYRKDGGLYNPISNQIEYTIEVSELIENCKTVYTVDLYKDFYIYSGLLSTLKTTNRILNVVASIFASENEFDTCLFLNEKKQLVEAIHGNVFLVFGDKVITPTTNEGCIKGVIRKKIIDILKKSNNFIIEEREISPFELQKADELFITNSIIDIQPVTNYRKKVYKIDVSLKILELLKKEYT
ncbi:MAG: aminotransferase class IV [Flavobacteriaceae bacterium]|nr:aminotransferase class IV [Flavobacteriaceae bacterium]